MKGKAKKTFSSGRDSKGKLILFEQGKQYDLSGYDQRKINLIKNNFEIKEAKEKEEK